jgi:hypothetical protein
MTIIRACLRKPANKKINPIKPQQHTSNEIISELRDKLHDISIEEETILTVPILLPTLDTPRLKKLRQQRATLEKTSSRKFSTSLDK